jgi:hypothetical protein
METIKAEEVGYNAYFDCLGRKVPIELYRQLFKNKADHNQLIQKESFKQFNIGWMNAYVIHQKQLRKEAKVDEFLAELKELCKKYKAHIYGGDIDSGGSISDYYFSFDINESN